MTGGETMDTPPAQEAAEAPHEDVLYQRKGIKILGVQLPPWRSPLAQGLFSLILPVFSV